MPTNRNAKTIRVGLLITASLIVLMIFLFFIGSDSKIFARKQEYNVQLESASGLAEGNPVRMAGVSIGVVKDIFLPRDPKQRNVRIELMVDKKFADRVRGDSRARLKKLGLLTGDSYIDITPGTPKFDVLPAGAIIPAQRQTNVDQLISSGEDLVDNLVQISYSMKNILSRVDRGEGLLGELTSSPETKQRLTDTVLATLNKTNAVLNHIESGRGVLGKLIYDDKYGEQLTGSLGSAASSLQALTANVQRGFESGNGMIPALLNDAEGKKRVFELVDNLRTTSSNLATFSASLQTGQGLVPRLMNDKAYGDQALGEFTLLVQQLNDTVRRINNGEGTAGKLIADPTIYESVNDILIGINESKLLRWLIRNRQQSGIDKRFDQQGKNPAAPAPAVDPPRVKSNLAAPVTVPAPPIPATTTSSTPVPAPPTTDTSGSAASPAAAPPSSENLNVPAAPATVPAAATATQSTTQTTAAATSTQP